ncbi:MAG: hypothetical protein ABFE08_22660 [Armatimonadia bacterium]
MLRRVLCGVLIMIGVYHLYGAAMVNAQRRYLARKLGVTLAQVTCQSGGRAYFRIHDATGAVVAGVSLDRFAPLSVHFTNIGKPELDVKARTFEADGARLIASYFEEQGLVLRSVGKLRDDSWQARWQSRQDGPIYTMHGKDGMVSSIVREG